MRPLSKCAVPGWSGALAACATTAFVSSWVDEAEQTGVVRRVKTVDPGNVDSLMRDVSGAVGQESKNAWSL
jgi:hypothetical protein